MNTVNGHLRQNNFTLIKKKKKASFSNPNQRPFLAWAQPHTGLELASAFVNPVLYMP